MGVCQLTACVNTSMNDNENSGFHLRLPFEAKHNQSERRAARISLESYFSLYLFSVTLKEYLEVVLFRLSWIHSPLDLRSWFWRVMIRLRWIACLCNVDLCILLFSQLGFSFTLWVINQLRRLNLRVQSPGWRCYFTLGPLPVLMAFVNTHSASAAHSAI